MNRSVALFSWEYPLPNSIITDLGYLVSSIASGLRAIGLEVHVVVPGDRDDSYDGLGIDVLRLGTDVVDHPNVITYGLSLPSQIIKKLPYLLGKRVDVVHGFEWGGCLMALAYKLLLGGSKLICSVLSTEYERGDPRSSNLSASIASIEEYVFSQSDELLIHSKPARSSISSNYTIKSPMLAVDDAPLDTILEVYT